MKNMIRDIAQNDVAVLIIDAQENAFEAGVQKDGSTTEHPIITKTMDVKQMVCVVNKMDHPSVNYSEARFKYIQSYVSNLLKKMDYKTQRILFIPISALRGDNVVEKQDDNGQDNMPWY